MPRGHAQTHLDADLDEKGGVSQQPLSEAPEQQAKSLQHWPLNNRTTTRLSPVSPNACRHTQHSTSAQDTGDVARTPASSAGPACCSTGAGSAPRSRVTACQLPAPQPALPVRQHSHALSACSAQGSPHQTARTGAVLAFQQQACWFARGAGTWGKAVYRPPCGLQHVVSAVPGAVSAAPAAPAVAPFVSTKAGSAEATCACSAPTASALPGHLPSLPRS